MVCAMATLTPLEEAQSHLSDAHALLRRLRATGQSFSLSGNAGGRSLTNIQYAEVREDIKFWQQEVNRLTAEAAGSGGGPRLVPMVCYD